MQMQIHWFKRAALKHVKGVRLQNRANAWFPGVLIAGGRLTSYPPFSTSEICFLLGYPSYWSSLLTRFRFAGMPSAEHFTGENTTMPEYAVVAFACKGHKHPSKRNPKAYKTPHLTIDISLESNKTLPFCYRYVVCSLQRWKWSV